jgi:SNF2 family DNA or RNA helicase
MRTWRSLFTQTMLTRGKEYYRAGKAKKLSWESDPEKRGGDIYEATVRGSRNYHVVIKASAGVIREMSCTCPYAADGSRCKHEAAVLLAIEDEYEKLHADPDEKEAGKSGSGAEAAANGSGSNSGSDEGNAGKGENSWFGEGGIYDILDRDGKVLESGGSGLGSRDAGNPLSDLRKLWEETARERKDAAGEEDAEEYHPDNYRYFHPEEFRTHLKISAAEWKEAEELLHPEPGRKSVSSGRRGGRRSGKKPDFKILEFHVSTGYLQDQMKQTGPMVGQAILRFRNDYDKRAVLMFDQHRIISSQCEDWDCYYDNGYPMENPTKLCIHEIVALRMLEDYLKDHNLGDASSYDAESFLSEFSHRDMPGEAGTEKDGNMGDRPSGMLTMEPRLELEDGMLSATFYIGKDRLYKIKNLSEYVKAMQNRDRMKFGSKTEFQMGEESLKSDEDRDWFHFIREALENHLESQRYMELRSSYADSYTFDYKANLPLIGSWLDRFADLIGARPFELWDKHLSAGEGKKTVHLRDKDITPTIAVVPTPEKATEPVDGVRVTCDLPRLMKGLDHLYYYQGQYLNRVTRESSERVEMLLRNTGGRLDLVIGRNYLGTFYHDVLPKLRDIADIREEHTERLKGLIPPKPAFTAYLDYERPLLMCTAEAAYGKEIYPIADAIEAQAEEKELIPAYRDAGAELAYCNELARYFNNYDRAVHVLYSEKDEDRLFQLLDHGIDELLDYGEVRMTEQFRNLGIRRRLPMKVGVNVGNNLLDLTVSSEDLTEDEIYQILYMYRRKKKYVRLKDGSFFKLEQNDTVDELNEMLEALQIPLKEFVKGKMELPAYRALYLDKMLEQTEDLYAVRDRKFKQLIKEFKTVEDSDFEVPDSLAKTLRKYQKEGYRWLRILDRYGFGGILADEMGLGKTLQVITALLATKLESEQEELSAAETERLKTSLKNSRTEKTEELSSPDPKAEKTAELDSTEPELPGVSLIISPASLIYNWEEELHRFAPELKTLVVAGTAAERKSMLADYRDYDVLVTSYDLLKRDIASYDGMSFRYEVIDEAQYIKNPGTAAAKAVKLIRAKTRYALTGTPIENRLSELWSIFDYLMPGFLYRYEEFHSTFEQPIVNGDEKAGEQLKRMVAPFILRRLKKDVLKDLPDKLEEIRYVQMGKEQQKIYDAEVLRMKKDLSKQTDEDFRKGKLQILAAITRIRQICCDPSLCCEGYRGESAKKEAVMDLIHTLIDEGHRALLFSQFTSMLALIREELVREKIPFYEITGATRKEERTRLVREFNENSEVPVFLISLKAGGTGLNLTGADVVIHYDPWWNTSAEDQATDRAHRIGQKRVVTVYKMIIRNSIEDRILEMQAMKRDLADQILNGDALSSSTITREDLMQILS